MQNNADEMFIEYFTLESSAEVPKTISVVKTLQFQPSLFHIKSYIHNTVLVQNLKTELQRQFPESKIVLLKTDSKNETVLGVFGCSQEGCKEHTGDILLEQLYEKYKTTTANLEEYRNQLFLRYFTDNLTNLPNLYQLRKDLQQQEDEHSSTLVLIKIDNFQTINNFYGFVVGDYVVEYVSNHLQELITDAKLYRLSGTEFGVLLDTQLDFYKLKKYLTELYDGLKNIVVDYQDIDIFVNFTLASSVAHDHSNLFSKVSMALKYAQQNSLPFWIYEDTMNFENEYARNLNLSRVVRDAVNNDRVIPYYQAIYDNKEEKITKYECLARLIDDEDKVIEPDLFIPITKSLKIYSMVTKMIVDKAFKEFEASEYEFSVNLSIEDVMHSEIFEYIIDKLEVFREPSRVTFELLESEAILDFHKVSRFINEIKRRGAKVAIDDFGSGYSNFAYIINLKVDYIKIDGSLIENIATDNTSLVAVETIVGLAKRLGIKTVAEYVFSSTILAHVKRLGIDYSQGFLIDKPSLDLREGLPT